jgi:hypothetical protein
MAAHALFLLWAEAAPGTLRRAGDRPAFNPLLRQSIPAGCIDLVAIMPVFFRQRVHGEVQLGWEWTNSWPLSPFPVAVECIHGVAPVRSPATHAAPTIPPAPGAARATPTVSPTATPPNLGEVAEMAREPRRGWHDRRRVSGSRENSCVGQPGDGDCRYDPHCLLQYYASAPQRLRNSTAGHSKIRPRTRGDEY